MQEEKNNKTEIQEVLEIVNFIKDHAASQKSVDALADRVGSLETRVGGLETQVGGLEKKVDSLAVKMVTKEYLDDKLADLNGSLTLMMRKEDAKVRALIEKMEKKQVLSKEETKAILSMEPFSQLAL